MAASLAGVVILALVAWLIVGGVGSKPTIPVTTPPVPATPPPATSSATASTSPGTSSADPSPTDDWGAFPPTYLDALKDLSEPQFPETVGAWRLDGETGGEYSVIVDYVDADTRFLSVNLALLGGGPEDFRIATEGSKDVAYHGRAVCGLSTETSTPIPFCVMAGTAQTMRVNTASEIPLQELAAFTEELYDAL